MILRREICPEEVDWHIWIYVHRRMWVYSTMKWNKIGRDERVEKRLGCDQHRGGWGKKEETEQVASGR